MIKIKKSLVVLLSLISISVFAAVPQTISYQGVLTDSGGVPVTGPVSIEVRIFDAAISGTQLYSEGHPWVTVDEGVFTLTLGGGDLPIGTFDAATFAGNTTWLELEIDTEVQAPRQAFLSTPYALHAEDALTANLSSMALAVPTGTIDNSMLAESSITSNKIANNTITADKIADNSIGVEQLVAEDVADSLSSLGAGIVTSNPSSGTLLAAGYIRVGEVAQPFWESISQGIEPPAARSDSTLIWTGSRIIMWGGNGDAGRLNDGFTFDFATNAWSPISVVGAPAARMWHTAVWTGTHMLVWGGIELNNEFEDGGAYDPVTDSWTTLPAAPAALGKRIFHTAVWTGTEMIVYGGVDLDSSGNTYYDNGAAYNPATGVWTMLSSTNAPEGRAGHAMVWTGTKIVVWGGGDSVNFGMDNGGIYDPLTDTWTTLAGGTTNSPAGRKEHTGIWTGTEMVIWGGFVNGVGMVDNGAAYDPTSDLWRTIATPPTALGGRQKHRAIWSGTEMIIVGGEGIYPVTAPFSVAAYNPSLDSWRSLAHAGGRKDFPAVWTSNSLFLFGGKDANNNRIASAKYWLEATDTWLDVASAVAPTARIDHVAEWTGSKLLIWGGLDNTGGIYDPNTNGWNDLPTNGAPSGLSRPVHAWTGSEMIVWGGSQAGDSTSSEGGRYNPDTQTWSSISNFNEPTGRLYHAGAWTGTELIIWGGHDGAIKADGKRYNPITDSWTTMSTVGAPSARYFHSAIWTGTEFIVWGGNQSAELQDGGRYNPITDSWSTMSTIGAPDPRRNHSVIWTGTEMIVWGGYQSGTGRLRSGGRYNPSTNTWADTGDPSYGNRTDHSATWTGTEMLIWGGVGFYEFGAVDGMLYNPTTDSWRIAPTDGAPSSRSTFAYAWTGDRFAVWGGEPTGSSMYTNTGGFLNLSSDNKLYIYMKP